uniref:Uncharacterized protein n=1 Tax=Candidatus Kentrum sp. FM TaxID=2126340 RepID=A0A450SBR8_9GAMM|nr:MAG: hypothetical protein BECKFM1743A_GA0114220_100337 [Candidatus Kentron sp. FM]VFJ49745.1 MAG: hypothetical protein BECKFM1743C_GA0114222_100754 [Candidatus Kentron sp. FM]VFK10492.1 MAG: hypothetical protein BECKFM1743B_GA0114221_101421 [Candidatus Kentron sp. FM]
MRSIRKARRSISDEVRLTFAFTWNAMGSGRIFLLGEGKPGIRFYERFRVKESPPVGWNRRALLMFVFFAIRPHAVFHA